MNRINVMLPVSFVFLMLFYTSVFYVGESQKALKFRLGEIIYADFNPGIHFMLPFFNNVKKFDARILTLDAKAERFLTFEKKNVIVDSFAKWRISDPTQFYTTMSGDYKQANLRLDQILKDAMRGEFGQRTIKDLVSQDRSELRWVLIERLRPVSKEFGIELVDVRIKRIDLPDEVSNSVYRRMEAERERVAREFRSQGAEQAELISAEADKESQMLIAEAYSKAENIRGRGDAKAAEIYSASYSKNKEFFAFYRSLIAYQEAFENTQDTMVLEPKSDFFRYFTQEK